MKRWQKISIMIVTVLLVASLATALGFAVENRKQYQQELDNLYKKSYYDAMDSMSDVEMKLSKLTVAEGSNSQHALLTDVWINSELACNNLSQLSAKNSQMDTIIKFFNQTSDYCKYLAKKVADGQPLTSDDRDKLDKLYKIVANLQDVFAESSTTLMNGGSLVGRKLNEGISLVGANYEKFNNDSSVDYPEMIYDGPFSDGLSDRQAKFLKDKQDISKEQAETILKQHFKNTKKLEYRQEVKGSIPAYMFNIVWEEGEGSVQITKKGGVIAEYAGYKNIKEPTLSEDECKDIAIKKIKQLGFDNLTPVWVTNSHSSVYINFAYSADDTIFYPDLIKIKIAADNGDMIGLESANFIYNHIGQRAFDGDIKSIESARQKVSSRIKIDSQRLCVIPTEWNTELLAYEFSGTSDNGLFFVYIDAVSLNEIKVMKVIERDGGKLIS